jgi:hypothetical protein
LDRRIVDKEVEGFDRGARRRPTGRHEHGAHEKKWGDEATAHMFVGYDL